MSITIVPRITVDSLEKILSYLSEPNKIEVMVFGDTFSITNKFANDRELKLVPRNPLAFNVENPTKEKLLKFVRDDETFEHNPMQGYTTEGFQRIGFNKAEFVVGRDYLKDGVRTMLTPWVVEMDCRNVIPTWAMDIAKVCASNDIRFTMRAGGHY